MCPPTGYTCERKKKSLAPKHNEYLISQQVLLSALNCTVTLQINDSKHDIYIYLFSSALKVRWSMGSTGGFAMRVSWWWNSEILHNQPLPTLMNCMDSPNENDCI